METQTKNTSVAIKNGGLKAFFKQLGKKISRLFEPEEVEVTFKIEKGKAVSYTYTKVEHKQVA